MVPQKSNAAPLRRPISSELVFDQARIAFAGAIPDLASPLFALTIEARQRRPIDPVRGAPDPRWRVLAYLRGLLWRFTSLTSAVRHGCPHSVASFLYANAAGFVILEQRSSETCVERGAYEAPLASRAFVNPVCGRASWIARWRGPAKRH